MAIKDKLGDNFYLFRKAQHVKQLLVESHGGFKPSDQKTHMPNLTLVWFNPHGMTNSGGYFIDDILGGSFSASTARYHSLTQGIPEFNYIISKFRTKAAANYDQIGGFIDARRLAIDVVTVRERFSKSQPRLLDLLGELAARNLPYQYVLCNFCRESTAIAYSKANEHDVHSNPKVNLLTTLPSWDNSNA